MGFLSDLFGFSKRDVLESDLSTNPSQPQRSSGRSTVDADEWQVTRGDTSIDGPPPKDSFSRAYSFAGLPPPDTTGMIRIECTLESGGMQRAADGSEGLSLNRSVRFYFRPFRLPHEMEFVLRLTTTDGSEGGAFDVIASPSANDMVVLSKFGGRNDTATLLRALMAGTDLKFELLQDDDTLVKLHLPNDVTFKRLWDASAQRFAELEVTYEVVRFQREPAPQPKATDPIAEARKNPKEHAVWMVEQEPGEYKVLLVKLDCDGQMENAWGIGETFSDRRAQGVFALDLARDLRINLMDVVDR